METEQLTAPPQDRRVRRSRAALMQAALTLVSERGTSDVSITDIAEAADVSRPVVYQHFGDRDTLLLETALDLVSRELLQRIADPDHALTSRARPLALARHFAGHRAFYRAMLTSPCGFALNKALSALFIPLNRQLVQQAFGDTLDAQSADDLATFLTGAGAAFVNSWVVETADPLDPEEFTDRHMRMLPLAAAALRHSTTRHDTEPDA